MPNSLHTWRAIRDHLNTLDESDKRLDSQVFTFVAADGSNLPVELMEFDGQDEFIESGDLFLLTRE